ncbi:hypothetical protein O3P69_003436 [Scylla paramamosain]|uniref:Uncharacterized protein n=1 Tax=Scylla paramamosain TaxID=85552 RepID=A0AAW0UM68_SCYPA
MGTALPRPPGQNWANENAPFFPLPLPAEPGKLVFILPRHCWVSFNLFFLFYPWIITYLRTMASTSGEGDVPGQSVTSRRVYNAVDRVNPTGTPRADRRGKHVPKHAMPLSRKNLVECHIKSFPTVSSHYTRAKSPLMRYLDTEMTMKKMYFLYKEWLFDNHEDEEPVTFSYYKKVVQGFRLGFKPPSTDTCSKCDRYEVSKKDANTEEEAQGIQAQWDEHLSFAKEGMKQELDNTEEDDSTEDEDEDHLEYDSDSEDIVDDPQPLQDEDNTGE